MASKSTLGLGVIENENGPHAWSRGSRITGQMFSRKISSASSVQRSAARDIKWHACEYEEGLYAKCYDHQKSTIEAPSE